MDVLNWMLFLLVDMYGPELAAVIVLTILLLIATFIVWVIVAAVSSSGQDYRREVRDSADKAFGDAKQTSAEFRQQVKKTMEKHRK